MSSLSFFHPMSEAATQPITRENPRGYSSAKAVQGLWKTASAPSRAVVHWHMTRTPHKLGIDVATLVRFLQAQPNLQKAARTQMPGVGPTISAEAMLYPQETAMRILNPIHNNCLPCIEICMVVTIGHSWTHATCLIQGMPRGKRGDLTWGVTAFEKLLHITAAPPKEINFSRNSWRPEWSKFSTLLLFQSQVTTKGHKSLQKDNRSLADFEQLHQYQSKDPRNQD